MKLKKGLKQPTFWILFVFLFFSSKIFSQENLEGGFLKIIGLPPIYSLEHKLDIQKENEKIFFQEENQEKIQECLFYTVETFSEIANAQLNVNFLVGKDGKVFNELKLKKERPLTPNLVFQNFFISILEKDRADVTSLTQFCNCLWTKIEPLAFTPFPNRVEFVLFLQIQDSKITFLRFLPFSTFVNRSWMPGGQMEFFQ